MTQQIIKDFYNRIQGYVEYDNRGNGKAFDFYRRLLGTYVKDQNVTKDFYNRIVSRGDSLVALIYQESAKQEAQRNNSRKK